MSDLIDRQALRAAHGLGSDCHDCKRDMKSCQYDRDYSLMDFCEWIDDAPTASPWHRVEEELPKHGQHILICLRFTDLDGEEEPAKTVYGYFENFEKKGRRYWTWEDEEAQMQACMIKESDFEPEYGTTRITHWMPLPEPPKEDA